MRSGLIPKESHELADEAPGSIRQVGHEMVNLSFVFAIERMEIVVVNQCRPLYHMIVSCQTLVK